MFVYDSVHTSRVLLVSFTHNDYHVSYHHTEQDGRELITFVQTRRANNDDIERFQQWLQPQLEQFQVVNLFRDTLRDCLAGRAIRVSMIR
jgi:pantothenate kinase-related protein Tda10